MNTYKVQILAGVVYEREITAENMEEALEIASEFDPTEHHCYVETETERTIIIEHRRGRTAFGFGVEASILGVGMG